MRLRIMHPIHPPLLPQRRILLEEMEQVRRKHRPAREEERTDPPVLEIVRRLLVRENVHEQHSTRLQRTRNLGNEQLVVLHVLEQLDRDYTVKRPGRESLAHHAPVLAVWLVNLFFAALPSIYTR
jgi:hypothetical protein